MPTTVNTKDGGQDPSDSGKLTGRRLLVGSSRRAAGRTCLEQPYTLIQDEVKRTFRDRTLRRERLLSAKSGHS